MQKKNPNDKAKEIARLVPIIMAKLKANGRMEYMSLAQSIAGVCVENGADINTLLSGLNGVNYDYDLKRFEANKQNILQSKGGRNETNR